MPRVTIQIQHNVELVVASQPIVERFQAVAPKRTTSTAFRQTNASVKPMIVMLYSSTVRIVARCLVAIMSQARLRARKRVVCRLATALSRRLTIVPLWVAPPLTVAHAMRLNAVRVAAPCTTAVQKKIRVTRVYFYLYACKTEPTLVVLMSPLQTALIVVSFLGVVPTSQ